MSRSLLNSFIKNNKVKQKGDCYIWQLSCNGAGYPQGRIGGELVQGIHRVMLEAKTGKKIKKGNVCAHKCNNKKCLNPSHLTEKTVSENTQQAYDDKLM